jgi:hypothetical protein
MILTLTAMRAGVIAIIGCILAGSVLNVFIAHYCLLHHSPPFSVWPHQSAQEYWNRYAENSKLHGPARFHHISAAIGCDFFIIDASPMNLGDNAPPRMMITRAGIPFRSFEGMHSWGGVTPAFKSAIPITPRKLNVAWVSVLPAGPVPLGFVANTIFYAGMVWLTVLGPFKLTRFIRAARHRRMHCCPECSYDLRANLNNGCPECGWGRESAKV